MGEVTDDWKTVTLLFLPRSYDEFEDLLDQLQGRADLVGLAPLELGEGFERALYDFAGAKAVRSTGAAVAALTRMALDWLRMSAAGSNPDQPWVRLESVFGIDSVPAAVGRVIREAVEQAGLRDEINPQHPWQWLELAAAEYLAK